MGKLSRPTPLTLLEFPKLEPPDQDTLVSVITPTIGRQDILRCIDSVRAQTHKHVEHVIVADGVEASYKLPIEPTATLGRNWSTPRTGPGAYATNVGWLLGHGGYLYTLPDDDWIEPNAIETFIAAIGTADFAFSQVEFSTPVRTGCFRRGMESWISGSADLFDGNHATPDQFFHRRLLEFGMYFASGRWEASQPGQDVDLLAEWKRAGATCVFVDQVLHHHTVNH